MICRVAKFLKKFAVLEIPDIFGGEWKMLGPSLRIEKKREHPPGGPFSL